MLLDSLPETLFVHPMSWTSCSFPEAGKLLPISQVHTESTERKTGLHLALERKVVLACCVSRTRRLISKMQKYSCCDLQVLVLSEGHQLYFGPPEQVTDWFSGCLGYSFWPGQHGSVADWLMDLVSVGFSKPAKLGGTTMTSRADVVTSSELWHARRQKVLTHQLIPQAVSWTAPFFSQRKLWLHHFARAWPELFLRQERLLTGQRS